MIVSAAICPSPPLLARELTGAVLVLPELRSACAGAADQLLASGPDLVAVIGAGDQTRAWDPLLRLDLAGYAPGFSLAPGQAGAGPDRRPGDAGPRPGDQPAQLPLGLGLGSRLLDEAGYTGRRVLWSAGHDEPPAGCGELGARIADTAGRVALLVMADGGARRGPGVPGCADEPSEAFSAAVVRAVRDADSGALLSASPGLVRELMAGGRPCWQILAGALHGTGPVTDIRYCDDPFGVAYLVASLAIPPQPHLPGYQVT